MGRRHSDFLERFGKLAERYVEHGRIATIEFSGLTYQIEVIDETSAKSQWVFLQFDEEAILSDAFCSCEEEETCIHLAAAFLRIYNGQSEPLHLRFKYSLWNALGELFADHLGYEPLLKHPRFSAHGLNAKGTKKLKALTSHRPLETPENSLKFSSLSQEEIAKWREGRASPFLRYELSFWSDLAKSLMLLQDEGTPYVLTFEEDGEGLPTQLTVTFPDIELFFAMEKSDLNCIISTLDRVQSPLKVHKEGFEKIQEIHYDREKRCFHVLRVASKSIDLSEGIALNGWIYVRGDGFYPKEGKAQLNQTQISESEISAFLSSHRENLARYLKNETIHRMPVHLAYDIWFDDEWNWHFAPYLFQKGDLQSERSALFGKWGYLEEKGFYPLKEAPLFEMKKALLSASEVSSFINRHRHFLSSCEGFSIHLASVETFLTYKITAERHLVFLSKFALAKENRDVKDFGEWIYYKGEGFFSKKISAHIVVSPGLEVPPQAISPFIKNNRIELEGIPGFFSDVSPLLKRGLRLECRGQNSLLITPEAEFLPEYSKSLTHFYGDFLYVEGKGFYELPAAMRLPDRYTESVVIHKKELASFFEHELSKITPFLTYCDPKVLEPKKRELELMTLSEGPLGTLKAEFFYQTEHGKIAVKSIFEAMQTKMRFLFSEAGRFDLQSEDLAWIRELKQESDANTFDLKAIDFLRLDITEGIFATEKNAHHFLEKLRHFVSDTTPSLTGLKSELRLYQKSGLSWLWFLYENNLSGLLCDDMGLGKTHQAMALIAGSLNKIEEGRILIVAPTSVIYHWQDKLRDFLPHLPVYLFHGLKRHLKRLPKNAIVLTSYGILRIEKENLEKIDFEIAIFDEAQVAKNPASLTHEALLKIKAKMRLGLSGTPIENNLRDLKALFDLVLPGYMPPETRFKEHFTIPIEREGSSEKKEALSRLVKPFILRRKKVDVLSELPEKSEDKIGCELSEMQEKLYLETLEKGRGLVGEERLPFIHIFSVLSKLKQICDHPALLMKDPTNYKNYTSGKWELFVELLDEAMASEQKVVIFSQYLHMLDIIELHLQARGWGYAQIRGKTANRREELRRFQEDPRCLVFIGSLQAAGLGIDLTAASIVILYDRWWNLARESQAIDRVHRIGQKWGVQVYKLITRGTIEEKIDQIIMRKGVLLEEIVQADDENMVKRFTRDELIDLLSYNPHFTS